MGKVKDIAGNRYGRLVAIEPTDKRTGYGSVIWKCQCDCGNVCYVSRDSLRKVKSCGCLIKKNDLKGKRFGMLTVMYRARADKNRKVYWHCRCDCGNEKDIAAYSLTAGITTSCGCYHNKVLAGISTTHGLSKTRIYNIYCNMKTRCYNPNSDSYKNYGEKGITICPEWLDEEKGFTNFYNWSIANGYADNLTIERKDISRKYCPENCCWITKAEQTNNTKRTIWIEILGEKKNLKQWTDFMGWKYGRYTARHERGNEIFTDEEIRLIKNKIMEVKKNE